MNAPFYKFGLFGEESSLIIAFLIGIGFGFFLERAGFGNARKLAAQFYFRDLRVLKVMFTAIITAMTGLYVLGRLGFVDLSLVYLTPTFLVPQIVGGLILGVGFIIGGYCPGTSCVSAATGRIDGMVYLAGMVGGLLGFAEIYPSIEKLSKATALGQVTLSGLFQIPYGLLVFGVVLLALGAFLAAEWAEGRFGGLKPGQGALLEPTRKLTSVRVLALGFVLLGLFALLGGSPYGTVKAMVDTRALALEAGKGGDHVEPSQLADWIIEGRADYLLLDLRSPEDFTTYHIPGAQALPLAELNRDSFARNERLVFYSEGSVHSAQAWVLLKALGFPHVYLLKGGLEAWKEEVLHPLSPETSAPAREQIAFAKREAVAKYFGGAPRIATGASPLTAENAAPLNSSLQEVKRSTPPPKAPSLVPSSPSPSAPKKKKKEGC